MLNNKKDKDSKKTKGRKVKQLKNFQLPKTQKSKIKKRLKSKKRFILSAVIILIALLIIIILILLIQSGIMKNPLENFNVKPKLFLIKDRCSLIVGQLIHTIEDEDACRMRCKTECEVREMKFHDSEFIKKENDCNECKCYCK